MLLKIFWGLDVLVILMLIASMVVEQPEKGKFAYIALYIILIGVSYFIKETHPKAAILIAGIPVFIPILIILFLFFAFTASSVFK